MNPFSAISDNLRGIVLMLMAMGAFAINDGFIKAVGNELSLGQVILIRGLFATTLVYFAARYMGQLAPLKTAFSPLLIARSFFEAVATMSFLTALFNMTFANVAAIMQALPLTVTLGAALWFREQIGVRRITAILIGLIGVLLIIRPGTEAFNIYSLSCLITVFAATVRDLISKRLDKNIPSMFVALQTAIVVTCTGFVLTLFAEWQPVTARHVGILATASVFLIIAYFSIVSTMRFGEIAVIAPFRYSILLFSILIGMVAFEEYPDWITWVGSAIIVATGLYTLYRERIHTNSSHAKSVLGTADRIR